MKKIYETEQPNEELTLTISLAMTGDEQAYEELLKKYAKYILMLVHNFSELSGEEEDIAQEVAIQIYRSIGSLESPYAITAWLRRLVLNTVNNYFGKHRRHQGHSNIDDAIDIEDSDTSVSPHDAAMEQDDREQLAKLIRQLPASQRSVIFMYYYENMSYKEISKTLGIKAGTVATNLKKARSKLEKSIGEQMKKKEAAFSAAITASFDYEAEHFATQPVVDRFADSLLHANKTGIERLTDVQHALHGSHLASNIAIGIGTIVLVGSLTFAGVHIAQNTQDTPVPEPAKPQTIVYTAEGANIEMHSNGEQGNVNPYAADLIIADSDGVADGWFITDESGVELAAGDGTAATIPQALASGKYFITWKVTSKGVATATIKKEFHIASD
jgi:RNA polymerase sigma-70 factor (ECF subfamily)